MRRFLIAVLVAGLLGLLLLGWMMFGDHSSFETRLDRYAGLPPKASDITVCQNQNLGGVFVADFEISESDFLFFAAEKDWSVQPISGSAFVYQAKAFQEGSPDDKKEITDGFYYSQRAGNGGGVTVAYDRQDGRAYIQSSAR